MPVVKLVIGKYHHDVRTDKKSTLSFSITLLNNFRVGSVIVDANEESWSLQKHVRRVGYLQK
jgi:hypothetical protein